MDPCEDIDSNINNPPLVLASPEIPAPSNYLSTISCCFYVATRKHFSRLNAGCLLFIFVFPGRFRPRIDEESLLFHTLRDSNVIIINDGKTAHRPK